MIRFGQLTVEGYCSILYHEENLGYIGMTQLRGINGVGKTTFLSAILWVLYGVSSKEVKDVNTWKKLRPKDYKGTMVSIYWESNGHIHQVIRCSNYTDKVNGSKGGDRLIYIIDGEEPKNKRKAEIQQMIIEDLGMSQRLFKNSVMFGQGVKRLVQESNTDKKEIFEEVFEVSYLSKAKKIAKDSRDKIKKEFDILDRELDYLIKEAKNAKSTYNNLKDNETHFNSNKEAKLSKLNKELDKIKASPKAFNKAKESFNKLEASLGDLNGNYKKKLDKYLLLQEELEEVTSIEGLDKLISSIIKKIKSNPDAAISKLNNLKENIIKVNSFNKTKSNYLEAKNKLVVDMQEKKSTYMEYQRLINKSKDLKEELLEVSKEKLKISSPKYKKLFKEYSAKILDINEHHTKLKSKLEDYDWVINEPLGNKGIKSYLLESALNKLNEVLETYSRTLGFKIEFSIDLNSVKKDFYTLIEINGNIADYEELSGGQKQLVNIAMAFAIHESTTVSKDINMLFLDEVFESLSPDNVEIVLDLIKSVSKGRSIWIITHQSALPLNNARVKEVNSKEGLTIFQ